MNKKERKKERIAWTKMNCDKREPTINVFHQGLCDALHLVPERSGDLKVCQLRSNAVVFCTWLKTRI